MLRKIVAVALVALIAAVAAAPASSGSVAAAREFEGTVVSVNRDNRTFRLRDCERGTVRIKVNRRTRFERLDGFSGLHKGIRDVESVVRRKNGRWGAREVEISGGGGEHRGGDDD